MRLILFFRSEFLILQNDKITTEREHQKELKELEKEVNKSRQQEVDNLKEQLSKVSFDPVSVISLTSLFIWARNHIIYILLYRYDFCISCKNRVKTLA